MRFERSIGLALGLTAVWLGVAGCSVGGAASTGMSVFRNTKSNKLDVRIFMDGQEAKRNELAQAATGHSKWKIKERVGAPTFRYELKNAESTGRVSNTTLVLYKKVGKEMSTQPEFTIVANSTDASAQLQPGQTYDLTNLGGGWRVLDWESKPVSGVTLTPDTEYMLQFVLRADQSETAQIYFQTK
jgi:hypothetical protein